MLPLSLFDERSNDSSATKFPDDGGILPVKLLRNRLSTSSVRRSPIASGIFPENLLLEKSMVVKMGNALVYSNSISDLFHVTLTET